MLHINEFGIRSCTVGTKLRLHLCGRTHSKSSDVTSVRKEKRNFALPYFTHTFLPPFR